MSGGPRFVVFGEALTDFSSRLNDAQWGKIVSQFLG